MIAFPEISPEIIRIGPIALKWYGMMYVLGFIFAFHILKARIRKGFLRVPYEAADSYITYVVIGMLLGSRLTYVFVYNWHYYSIHPSEILAIWSGGLSFHGAMVGMIVASWLFARRYNESLHSVLDTLAIGSTLGLFVGRIGNFINAELYGRTTDVPWAMIFPTDPTHMPRHPSQLYQSFTEGILLFFLLGLTQKILLKKNLLRDGMLGATFVAGYGLFRFFIEYTREPDPQLGLLLGGNFSMGQILCFIMIVVSVLQYTYVIKTQRLKDPRPLKKEDLPKESWLERVLGRWTA